MNRTDIANIFQESHKQLRLDDLTKLDEKRYVMSNIEKCSFKTWKEKVTKLGYDVERFYVAPEGSFLNQYYYVGEYATVGYPILKLDWLGADLVKGQSKTSEHCQKLFEEGNYTMYFFPEGNTFANDYFIKYVDKIPKEQRFNVFVDMYTILESGFTMIPKTLIDELMELSPKAEIQKTVANTYKVKDGKVTIYRGTHSTSTPIEESISWTASIKVAKMFANRYEKGTVYRAQVPVSDILYYTDERNEEEVWVNYDKLENIKKLK